MIYRTYLDLRATPEDWQRAIAKGFRIDWPQAAPRLTAAQRCDYVKAAVDDYLALKPEVRFLKGTLKRIALKHGVAPNSICMRIKRMKDRGQLP